MQKWDIIDNYNNVDKWNVIAGLYYKFITAILYNSVKVILKEEILKERRARARYARYYIKL